MSKRMQVYKPKQMSPGTFSETGYHNEVYLGSRTQQDPNDIPLGLVALSVPFKKGRRKLVKGQIHDTTHSCPYDGLQYEYFFRPANQYQVDKFKKLVPDVLS